MIYTAEARHGTGKATIMHERRGQALGAAVGHPLVPGTLNVVLDRPLDWSGATEHVIPDAVSWSNLDGPWNSTPVRLKPVVIGGEAAWAFRPLRSNAPANLVELLSCVRLRDVVRFPATMEAP